MPRMSSPVKGYVSQEYRTRKHLGIDIATGGKLVGVHAAFAGIIERIITGRKHGNRSTDSYAPGRTGNYVVVRNPDGERQLYNHTKALKTLSVGQAVVIGQRLGTIDMSGNTTGPHLHYEEWTASGVARNPRASFNAFDVAPGAKPVKASAPPAPAPRRTLKRGMKGSEVGELQRALNRFKATPDRRWPNGDLRVDNDFGSYTEARVKDLQERNGLFVDGIAGPKTLDFLGI